MNYLNNDNILMNIPRSELIISEELENYINKEFNIMEGFYLSFSSTSYIDSTASINSIYNDNTFKTSWKSVTTVASNDGYELLINKEVLPLDYEEYGREDQVGKVDSKYKFLFIGYKNLLDNSMYPIIAMPIKSLSIISGVNTTIEFKLNIKCSIHLITTNDLSYINTLEDTNNYSDSGYYNIIESLNQLNKDKNVNEITSGSYENGVLKYK